jgi:hypothetical protein
MIPGMNYRPAYLFAVCSLMASFPACSSVGKSRNPVDGAAGSGGEGAGATDGAATEPVGGTDGAVVDSFSTTDAADDAVAMTPTEVCRAAIRAQAERAAACLGYSMEAILSVANLCPDYYFNANSTRSVANVAACLGPLAARSCTDFAIKLFPACLGRGQRPAGSGCVYSSQCQTGICGGNGTRCSTCRNVIPVGSSCAGGTCQDGSFCHPTTGICTDASTVVYATQGQPCDLSATPVVGCAGDLFCFSGSNVGTLGTCQPLPGAGQPCAVSTAGLLCAAGTTCTNLGVSGTDTCTLATCGAGLQCDAASYCASSDGGIACVPHPTVGQPCDDLYATCLFPAVCVGSTGKCAIPRAWGETCDDDNPCANLLSCVAGVCQPTESVDCPAVPSDGGTE